MNLLINLLFALCLSLLLVHEMDAVRCAEWRMFIVLKDMPDDQAHKVFTALHIPLYAAMLFLLLAGWSRACFLIVDIFLIAHALLHLLFEQHKKNGLKSPFSRTILYCAGAAAVAHLALSPWAA
jgi:hypothetical protein